MLPLGTQAPDFDLPDPDGRRYRLEDFDQCEALVVAFICNHCPYVKHIRSGLSDFARDYVDRNVAILAINANDFVTHPADSPDAMRREVQEYNYCFPYVYDQTQETAKAFRAMCTPEFYVFDREKRLAYRGQFDGARPGNDIPVTGADVRNALDALLDGREVDAHQRPSIGCNIKWKPGEDPDYAT